MVHKWRILLAVACGTFMATLDASIVNLALPTLTKEFFTDLGQVKWVIIVYHLMITCLLMPFGKLSDLIGRKKVFIFGFLVFTIGSAFCSVSGQLFWLIFSRAFQAVGAAALMANGPAIIASAFPARERGKALGTLAMFVSAGLISGPAIGGFLIQSLGWESIFAVNIPIGIIGILITLRSIPSDSHKRHHAVPFDWAGALIQSLFLVLFMVAFDPPDISVSGSQPLSISRWLALTLAFIVLGIFIQVESQTDNPLVDFSIFKNRTFFTGTLSLYFIFVAYSAFAVLIPFFLEEVSGYATNRVGVFMTLIPLMILIIAPLSGRLSDRLGSQELSVAGALVAALALFTMAGAFGKGLTEESKPSSIIILLCSIGIAMGLFQSPNNNAIMGSIPQEKLGTASALVGAMRNLGLVTGAGLATGIFSWNFNLSDEFVPSMQVALMAAAVFGLIATVVSFSKRKTPFELKSNSESDFIDSGVQTHAQETRWLGNQKKRN